MVVVSIVVPCYNEQESLPQLFSQIKNMVKRLDSKYTLDFVFVDDGSKDKTFEYLSKFKKEFERHKSGVAIRIIRHNTNRDLGGVLKTAFNNVKGDFIVTIDADCTYNLSNVPKMLKMIDDKTDIVTASPYHPEGSFTGSKYRIILSRTTSKIYQILTSSNIYTFTSIFRVYRRKVIDDIQLKSDGFIAVTEILVYALKKGYTVSEFPTQLQIRKFGQSKMRLLSTIWSHLKLMVRLSIS